MNKKYLYFFAVILLVILRILILNTRFPESLHGIHLEKLANILIGLRTNGSFLRFIGGWILPVFIFATLVYWLTEEDEDKIPKQFLCLPLVYLVFSMISELIAGNEVSPNAVWSQVSVIVPYGYIYILVWVALIWVLRRVRLVR